MLEAQTVQCCQKDLPPPPMGTKMACRSRRSWAGQCLRISNPIVPCPGKPSSCQPTT